MLTILLPLRNRAEFTGRFLGQVTRLPFKFLIADGSDEPQFTYTEYNYHYFGPDHTTQRWFKVYAALEMIETPYAMLADNDDLPTHNLQRCVDFLQAHPDFVCCSGRIQGFHAWPSPIIGPYSAVTHQYATYDTPTTYAQDTPSERVLAGFTNSWSYYGVYRTETLRQIWKEVCALGLTDLRVHEKFCAMRTLTLGKAHCDPSYTSYYRQHGTSQGAASYHYDEDQKWLDIRKVLAVMNTEGVVKYKLCVKWADWYYTRDRYLEGKWRKRLKRLFPNLAWFVQNRHRYLPHQRLPEAL